MPPKENLYLRSKKLKLGDMFMQRNSVCSSLCAVMLVAVICVANPAWAADPSKITIMVGGITKMINLPAKLAEQLGYFVAEGLNVELQLQPTGIEEEQEDVDEA